MKPIYKKYLIYQIFFVSVKKKTNKQNSLKTKINGGIEADECQ